MAPKLDAKKPRPAGLRHDGPWRILRQRHKKEYPAAAAILKKGDAEQGLWPLSPGR